MFLFGWLEAIQNWGLGRWRKISLPPPSFFLIFNFKNLIFPQRLVPINKTYRSSHSILGYILFHILINPDISSLLTSF